MPAMLEKNGLELSGKRRGRNAVNNPNKSYPSNGTGVPSWEEGSSGSSSDEDHGEGSLGLSQLLGLSLRALVWPQADVCLRPGGGGMRVGPQYQAMVPDYDPGDPPLRLPAARPADSGFEDWVASNTRVVLASS